MIYIDPPYNTGKDFIYKDNYKDNLRNYQEVTGQIDHQGNKLSTNVESEGRFHSNWLNMMYPRLILARNLLTDDGVIFISIDDNEVDNLKKICNEIFGYSNSLINTIWLKANAQNDARNIQKNHEYIIGYARNIEKLNLSEENKKNYQIKKDKFGTFYIGSGITTGGAGGTLNNRPNLGYTIYYNRQCDAFIGKMDYDIELARVSNNENEVYTDDECLINQGYIPIRPPKKRGLLGRWTLSLKKFNSIRDEIFISENLTIFKKIYVDQSSINDSNELEVIRKYPLKSIFKFSSSKGTSTLNEIMNTKVFDNPKPLEIISRIAKSISGNKYTLLDFFAGSSTTAHAVLELNKEDGGHRRFIQVQLPEPTDPKSEAHKAGFENIAEIGKERIRRVIKKIKQEKLEKSKDVDLGFKVFKLDSSNIKSWDGEADNLKQSLLDSVENIKEDRSQEDVLYEILLKQGLDLSLPIEERTIEKARVFNAGHGALMVCLADRITSKVAEGIGHWKAECKPNECVVIFKDTGFTDVEKTNSIQTLKRYGIKNIKIL